jgi:hypothetical protein
MKCQLEFESDEPRCSVTWSELPSNEERDRIDRRLMKWSRRIEHRVCGDTDVHGDESLELLKAVLNGKVIPIHVTGTGDTDFQECIDALGETTKEVEI